MPIIGKINNHVTRCKPLCSSQPSSSPYLVITTCLYCCSNTLMLGQWPQRPLQFVPQFHSTHRNTPGISDNYYTITLLDPDGLTLGGMLYGIPSTWKWTAHSRKYCLCALCGQQGQWGDTFSTWKWIAAQIYCTSLHPHILCGWFHLIGIQVSTELNWPGRTLVWLTGISAISLI